MNALFTYLALDFIVTGLFLIVAYKRRYTIKFYVRRFLSIDTLHNQVYTLNDQSMEYDRRIRTLARRIGKLKRKMPQTVTYEEVNNFHN